MDPIALRQPLISTAAPQRCCQRHTTATVLLGAGLLISPSIMYALQAPSPVALNGMSVAPPAITSYRVLVTGYGAFGNLTEENPAELTAMHLDNSCSRDHGICFVGRVEPVTRAGATDVANELMHISSGTAPYDAILHLGLESVAKGFRLEIVAANILAVNTSGVWSADVPCNKSLANGSYADIVEGGPCLLATTLPLDRVSLVHLHPNAAREYWSRDAGTYFCNEMYYRTLSVVRSRDLRPARGSSHLLPVVFVHLPTLALSNVTTNADMVKRLAAAIVTP